ncbi:MAG TPA: MFS transporter [Burkholderiales bacterium]|nr:MFS transporter [Burkholderiales bacterium]
MSGSTGEGTPHPAQWRRNARALATGNLLINIGWNASFAFLPLIVQTLGVERDLALWVGAMMLGYYGVSCVFTPVWGMLADHYGRKSMVLRAAFGMAAGFGLLAMTSHPVLFLVVLVFAGLANGFVPAGQALVATTTPQQHIGGALALTQIGASAGTLLGPLVGAALIGWLPTKQSLFWLTAAAMLVAGILASTAVREHHVRPAHALRIDVIADAKRLSHLPELKLLYYMQMLFAFCAFGATQVVALHTMELVARRSGLLGLGVEGWVAATAVGFTLAGLVALPFWGRLIDRLHPARVLALLLAGVCLSSVLTPLARDPLELTLARVVFAIFVSGLPPVLIRMIKDRAPPGMEGRTLAYGTSLQQAGSAVAPLIGGLLAPYLGLRGFFWLCSGLLIVGWALWRRRMRGITT